MVRTFAMVMLVVAATGAAAAAEEIDYKRLYAQTAPSVVLIYGHEGNVLARGTGSIVRGDGLVVTNAHVIMNDETKKPWAEVAVFLKPDRITGQPDNDLSKGFAAQVLAASPDMDLALLRIVNPPQGLPVIEISDDSHVSVGEATAAIGHPEQGARWSLTTGRIGGEWTDFEGVKGKDIFQMETSINHGNSGGPLVDGNGYMIGVNTAIARRSQNDGTAITGINFAIKSHVVRQWIALVNEQLADAPETRPQSIPPPQMVAKAPSAPPAAEVAPTRDAPPREPKTDFVSGPAGARRVRLSRSVPPPAPNKPRGFTSSSRPGTVLSSADLTRHRARAAFDELDREMEKETARRGK